MKVYQAINKVQSALAKTGISKDRKNQQQGYNFRGIDDVYCAIAPLLSEHGLCILPRIISRHCDERTNSKGTPLFYVTVEAEFDFVSAEDGSKHVVRTFGEAMDSADKATNKAMSAAYKYAAFQAFAIPTEGDNDADAHSHDIKAAEPRQAVSTAKSAMPSKEQADHMSAIEAAGSLEELRKAFGIAYNAAKQYGDTKSSATLQAYYEDAKKRLAQTVAA